MKKRLMTMILSLTIGTPLLATETVVSDPRNQLCADSASHCTLKRGTFPFSDRNFRVLTEMESSAAKEKAFYADIFYICSASTTLAIETDFNTAVAKYGQLVSARVCEGASKEKASAPVDNSWVCKVYVRKSPFNEYKGEEVFKNRPSSSASYVIEDCRKI